MPDHSHIAKQSIAPTFGEPTVEGRQVRRTRRTIAESAARAFTTFGYNETTIEKVAADAGVSQRTVHRHFGTKSALLAAGVAVRVADFLHRLDSLIASGELLAAAVPVAMQDGFLDNTPDSRALVNVAFKERDVWGRWLDASYRQQSRLAQILAAAEGRPGEGDDLVWTLRAGMLLNAVSTAYQMWAATPEAELDPMMQIAITTALPAMSTSRG